MNRFGSPVYEEYNPQTLRGKGLSENKKGLCFPTLICDDLQQLGIVFLTEFMTAVLLPMLVFGRKQLLGTGKPKSQQKAALSAGQK